MTHDRQMRLGLSMRYLGYHIAAWRHPGVPADGAVSYDYFLNTALKAEAAKFDMVFFADGVAVRADDNPKGALSKDIKNVELEPLTLLAALAARTSHVGLVATASTTYNEPYHIARKYASIDHISGGRAGWNIVTSWSEQEALNFNRDGQLGYEERYERAAEFVEVVKGLWESWEPDAFIRDKHTGVVYDEAKLHVLNHVGKHFKVRGPLNAAATPQGRPILVQAGASKGGLAIAAEHADVVYTHALDLAPAQAYYADLKRRAIQRGRSADDILIMPGLTPYVGRTRAEAQAKLDQLQDLIHPLSGLSMLYTYFGDLSAYDVDGPLPEIDDPQMLSIARNLAAAARKDKLSIRELYRMMAAGNTLRYVVGTPQDIADDMQQWFEAGAADGFNICPAILPGGLDDFAELVLPELRQRGLFRHDYAGTTLRGHLGLKDPFTPLSAPARYASA
jgi:FMN-dependent oxidoreductase (nitrilotriacetate monooxygenase family)